MAALDFPASPVNGQVYDPGTGTLYQWNGSQWDVYTGNKQGHAETRNRIVNPAMRISQENGNTGVFTSGSYPVDQWVMLFAGIAGQAVQGETTESPDGNTYAYLQSCGSVVASPAAGNFVQNIQFIEGNKIADFMWGSASARPVVLRFSAFTNIPGLYPVVVMNAANSRSYIKGINLTTGWQTIVIPIPGETTGVWPKDNTQSLSVRFPTVCGSNYIGVEGWQNNSNFGLPGMVNLASQANKNFIVTDVGLYRDPDNTGKAPPFVFPDYDDELDRCKRYWRRMTMRSQGTGTTYAGIVLPLAPEMRANSVVSYSGLTVVGTPVTLAGGGFSAGTYQAISDIILSATSPATAWWSVNLVLNARM